MAIESVSINDDCTGCGLCETTCPEVFELGDDVASVLDGADFNDHEDLIRTAAEECPVEAIQIVEG